VGIPKGQVALFQLAEAEVPPVEELRGDVPLRGGEYPAIGVENDIGKHEACKEGQRYRGTGPGESRKKACAGMVALEGTVQLAPPLRKTKMGWMQGPWMGRLAFVMTYGSIRLRYSLRWNPINQRGKRKQEGLKILLALP
jgi:hypothetical protein